MFDVSSKTCRDMWEPSSAVHLEYGHRVEAVCDGVVGCVQHMRSRVATLCSFVLFERIACGVYCCGCGCRFCWCCR